MIWIVLYLLIGLVIARFIYKRGYFTISENNPETYMIYAWITVGWLLIMIVMFIGDWLKWWD